MRKKIRTSYLFYLSLFFLLGLARVNCQFPFSFVILRAHAPSSLARMPHVADYVILAAFFHLLLPFLAKCQEP